MKQILSFFLSYLYPKRCAICDEPLRSKNNVICPCCKSVFPKIHSPTCIKCGRGLYEPSIPYCQTCLKHPPSFDRGFSLWEYGSPAVKQSLHRFKYNGRKEYADYYAQSLFASFPFLFHSSVIDILIPVPIHKNRYRIRGYNQAEAIAAKLSSISSLPVFSDFLVRTKNTVPLNQLDKQSRKQMLSGSFSISSISPLYRKPPNSVLLIDDIYTTGSTADLCSIALKNAGISKVFVLCLASSSA